MSTHDVLVVTVKPRQSMTDEERARARHVHLSDGAFLSEALARPGLVGRRIGIPEGAYVTHAFANRAAAKLETIKRHAEVGVRLSDDEVTVSASLALAD